LLLYKEDIPKRKKKLIRNASGKGSEEMERH